MPDPIFNGDREPSGGGPGRSGGPLPPNPRASMLPMLIGALIMLYFVLSPRGLFSRQPQSVTLATNEFVQAVKDGRIALSRIQEANRHINKLKNKLKQ